MWCKVTSYKILRNTGNAGAKQRVAHIDTITGGILVVAQDPQWERVLRVCLDDAQSTKKRLALYKDVCGRCRAASRESYSSCPECGNQKELTFGRTMRYRADANPFVFGDVAVETIEESRQPIPISWMDLRSGCPEEVVSKTDKDCFDYQEPISPNVMRYIEYLDAHRPIKWALGKFLGRNQYFVASFERFVVAVSPLRDGTFTLNPKAWTDVLSTVKPQTPSLFVKKIDHNGRWEANIQQLFL